MRTSATRVADLNYVWLHLSHQNWSEHQVLGLSQLDVYAQAKDWLLAHGAETCWLADAPSFILGVVDGLTWFLATEDFFASGLPGLRASRRFVRDAAARHGPLHVISRAPHPAMRRWFEFLGFEKVAGPEPAYEFLHA